MTLQNQQFVLWLCGNIEFYYFNIQLNFPFKLVCHHAFSNSDSSETKNKSLIVALFYFPLTNLQVSG